MATSPFSLRLTAEVKTMLKQEAAQMNRSESFVATTAIRNFLLARQQKRQAIDAAIEEANQGLFISSQAMGAWVDSWGSENELPPPEVDIKMTQSE